MHPSLCALPLTALLAPGLRAQDCDLEFVSLGLGGQPANNDSGGVSISYDGRFVAYASVATDLVAGDSNGLVDCFVTDRRAGTTERVSVSSTGAQANGIAWECSISSDGRHVVFLSKATNLDPKDTDTVQDVYIHDRVAKTTTLVSERFGTGFKSQGCLAANPSADGRWVAFLCTDADVLPGVPTWNTFVRDTWLGTTELASIGPAGQVEFEGGAVPHLSGDGRFVAFVNGKLSWGIASLGALNAVWLRDRQLGTTTLITATPSGEIANCLFGEPALSHDGRYAVFWSCSSNLLPANQPHGLYDIVRWDRLTGEYRTVSKTFTGDGLNSEAAHAGISADGTRVVYSTYAVDVTPGPQISPSPYLVDLDTDTTRCVLWNIAGDIANQSSLDVSISGDGRNVAFGSYASNLVRGITTNATQVYLRSCDKALPMAYCTPAKGSTGCTMRIGSTGDPSASAGSGFQVRLDHAPEQAPLLLLYGTSGPWGTPFGTGWLCVKAPVKRGVSGASGAGAPCSTPWLTDFNAFVASGMDPELVAGAVVYLQGWARNGLGDSQLSDALALVLEP
jgi:Tol biopolymer transport system component